MSNNKNFFVKKKEWSEVKDQLLGCYFMPYVQKVLFTKKPLIYVDCFAGKGKFEDGKNGSPLIALEIIDECKSRTTAFDPDIQAFFIEKEYVDELKDNLKDYPKSTIVSGQYEDRIESILSGKKDCNIFLYIDPYGIMSLKYYLFDRFADEQFNSIEMLINMNSFGFFRAACLAFGTTFDEEDFFDDLIEVEPTKNINSDKLIEKLNEVAGGDYWQPIIIEYKKNQINGYEAEKKIIEQYCKKISEKFRYVLNMPMRIKKGQRPKYRMIHVTNHRDGCLLMVDNISKCWQLLQVIQEDGQLSFIQEDFDNQIVNEKDIRDKVVNHFSKFKRFTSLYDGLADFFMEYGPICSTSEVKKILKEFEKKGRIKIVRNPDKTSTGKPSTFMTEEKGKTVSVRWTR